MIECPCVVVLQGCEHAEMFGLFDGNLGVFQCQAYLVLCEPFLSSILEWMNWFAGGNAASIHLLSTPQTLSLA